MPFREPGIRRTRAAGKDRRPFLDREREVGFDLLHLHSRSLRSELRGRVQRIALPDVAERITKFLEKLFLYRSEEHTSELQSLMRISYAVFCLKKKKKRIYNHNHINTITEETSTTP